jgi:hypothetical protein
MRLVEGFPADRPDPAKNQRKDPGREPDEQAGANHSGAPPDLDRDEDRDEPGDQAHDEKLGVDAAINDRAPKADERRCVDAVVFYQAALRASAARKQMGWRAARAVALATQ